MPTETICLLSEAIFFLGSLQPIDKQSLLDSGILCCLIHIFNVLLDPDEAIWSHKVTDQEETFSREKGHSNGVGHGRRLEVAFS